MKPKVLILIIGALRPGFVESIKSWEPVINLFDNAEILYVLRDRINLIPEALLKIQNIDFTPWFRRYRFFGPNSETNTILSKFIKDTSVNFDIPENLLYSDRMCESFLFETLPFYKAKRCSLHIIDNIQVGADPKTWSWHRTNSKNMFYSWKSASDFIIANNINFDYCIKIRPDINYAGKPEENKFKYIFDYCVKTNNIVLDTIFNTDPPSDQRLAGDQVAIGSRQNIMKYLQIIDYNHNNYSEYYNINDCHKGLCYYLIKNKITMANGADYIQRELKSWKLQDNIHFKRFLKYNIHMPHYKDFLTLLNQVSTSL
jgi:hypothetical protein